MMSPVDAFRTSRDVRLESGMRAKADVRRPLRAMGSRPNLPDGQITRSSVKPLLQKYFASLPTQISSLIRTVWFRQEGRCARHETRGGMRWTRRRQASNSEPDE